MNKQKLYKYIGYSGTITSPILLPVIDHLVMYQLDAKPGYHLTNGSKKVYRITVLEDEVKNWREVQGVID